jgi:hypothetical protein
MEIVVNCYFWSYNTLVIQSILIKTSELPYHFSFLFWSISKVAYKDVLDSLKILLETKAFTN